MKISISGTPADILLQSVYQSYQKNSHFHTFGNGRYFLMLFLNILRCGGVPREHPCDRSFVMLSGNA